MARFDAILELAMELDPTEREALAAALLQSLAGPNGPAYRDRSVTHVLTAMQAGLLELAALEELEESWGPGEDELEELPWDD